VATSLSLYAQWSETNYVVNFNSDGGAVSPTQSSFNIGNGSVVLPTPTYSGFVFSGWYSAASGGALVGVAGSLIAFSASTDLYAQWVAVVVPPIQALESTVNFGANGGVGSVTALTGVNGTSVTLPGGIGMSYAGKTFANWNTTANGSGTAYNVDVPLKLNSSVTLYAQWDTLLAFKSPAVLLGAVGRFSSGSSSLSSALKIQVRQLASLVKAGGYVLVTLYGYSSDSGTAAHKISISKSRANAVAGFLRARFVTLHVKGVSIKTAGEGAIKGKVSAAYRRVEVFVTA
jgi:outer membrane protein OmpA-like peptidoglycan-associated protein